MALDQYLVQASGKVNICFDCKKACGGCSWSALDPVTNKVKFEPIPGWTAKKVRLITSHSHGEAVIVDTFHITECPEFERDSPRVSNNCMLTPAESDDFLQNIKRILRRWNSG